MGIGSEQFTPLNLPGGNQVVQILNAFIAPARKRLRGQNIHNDVEHFMQRPIFLVLGLLLPMAADANEAVQAIPHRCENCTATPVEVATHSREMSDMCRSVHGTPRSGPDIQQGRFPHGPVFWAIDEATFACDGAAALFSTNHGAGVRIFVETNDGHATQAFEHAAFGVMLERSSDTNRVWLNVGGALCGQNTDGLSTADMRACQRPLKWDAVTRKVDFVPLSEIRELPKAEEQEAQPGGLPAKRIYDSGSELVSKRDYVLNEYWKDKIDLIPWKPRGATQGTIFNWPFASPDGRSLMVSLLQAPAVCTPKCPARFINAQHRVVLEIMVCADRTKHGFSPDNMTFIACGERFSIPQVDERTALLDNARRVRTLRLISRSSVAFVRSQKTGRSRSELIQRFTTIPRCSFASGKTDRSRLPMTSRSKHCPWCKGRCCSVARAAVQIIRERRSRFEMVVRPLPTKCADIEPRSASWSF
ncbi:hypothetical protein [Rhodopseudomonas parapalustris]